MTRSSPRLCSTIAALAFVLQSVPAFAQDAVLNGSEAELTGGATVGATAANVAAGDGNQQANVGIVARGVNGLAIGTVAQALAGPAITGGSAARGAIAEHAFAGSSGWIAANVAAGSANQQANVASISVGLAGQAVTATVLSQSRAMVTKTDASAEDQTPGDYATRIGDGAFEASSGLVQLNIAAGDSNSSANVFGLSIATP